MRKSYSKQNSRFKCKLQVSGNLKRIISFLKAEKVVAVTDVSRIKGALYSSKASVLGEHKRSDDGKD